MSSYQFDQPDHFTAGALGEPGQRTFVLQAAEAGAVISVKCEKQQVGALAEYLAGVLADLPTTGGEERPVDLSLSEPVVPEWVAGSIGVAYDETSDRVVLVVEELGDDEEPEAEADPSRLRVALHRRQVAAFIDHARDLVEAGRPPCPLCGQPLDPMGHVCPRTNGHRPPA